MSDFIPLSEYDKSTTYYEPPEPSNRKIWGQLFSFPLLFSFCILGYEILNAGTFPSMRTAVIMTSLIIIPFSYAIMCIFYLLACIVRFVISQQPLTSFWIKIIYYPFIFGGWYYFISIIYPIDLVMKSLFVKTQLCNTSCIVFFLISVCALVILLKANMSILNYRGQNDDTAEEPIPLNERIVVYILLIFLNLACILI